jgi:hypothetical protein
MTQRFPLIPEQEEQTVHFLYVNLFAVLACGVAAMILGFLWYSPILFAKPWVKEMGYDMNDKAKMEEMKEKAGPAYGVSFVASLVTAFILALILNAVTINTPLSGMKLGFAVWLGFVATVQLTGVLFQGNSMKLFAINTGYQLTCYLAMGAILSVWR